MKKISFFLATLLIILNVQMTVLAYSQEQMNNRETVTGEDGQEYIAQGQPVLTYATGGGLMAQEPFVGNDGVFYPAHTPLISYDEGGKTGNLKEQDNITFNDAKINGYDENTLMVDVLAEPVIPEYIINENGTYAKDENGDFLVKEYSLPTAEVGDYTGDIYRTVQDLVDNLNADGYLFQSLPEGATQWTVESYTAFWADHGLDIKEVSRLYNESFETKYREATYVDGQLVYKDVDITGIAAILGFGFDAENIREMSDFYKLYSVLGMGDTEVTIEELIEDIGLDPEYKYVPPTGNWSDRAEASVSARVWSDKYDVEVAIPTSEYVKGSLSASKMSWYYNVKVMTDSESYTQDNVTLYWDPYIYKWTTTEYEYGYNASGERYVKNSWKEEHEETRYRHSKTTSVTGTYTTHYFGVDQAHMNVLSGGTLTNSAVGQISSVGAGGLSGSIGRNGGIVFDASLMTTGGFSSYADTEAGAYSAAAYKIRNRIKAASYVKNDTLVISSTVLSGQTEINEEFGDTPYIAPSSLSSPSSGTNSNSGQKLIPSTTLNDLYSSSARFTYAMVPGFDGRGTYTKAAGASAVNVHTPVVNITSINNITTTPFINQKVVQEAGTKYLMLDESLVITIPRNGTHISARGYQTRNYNSYQAVPQGITNWGKIKDVKLPFDAYLHKGDERILIKAETWLSDLGYATSAETYTFTIPVWAEESKGNIETRVIAENTQGYVKGSEYDTSKIGTKANLNQSQYVASVAVPVEVIGKIYDLRISGTNDPGWTGIKGKDGDYVTAAEFPFGQAGQNKMTAYKFAPKLGYVVEFDFKTKGIKTDNVDVSIQPEGFYFVGKNGGTAEEVDLYYKTAASKYVKIETGASNSPIIVNLANKFMKVAASELVDSQRIMKNTIGVIYTYAENVNIGSMPELSMPEKLRLCYNNFKEYVNALYKKTEAGIIADAAGRFEYTDSHFNKVTGGRDTVIASVGHWYAGYRLPSSTVAVPKGTTVSQLISNPDIAKDGGYILVKYDIVGKHGPYDYLRYTGPESINEDTGDNTGEYEKDPNGKDKKWQDPTTGNPDPSSPTIPVTLPNGKPAVVPDGTILIFETDLRANNDYETEGTH